MTSPIKQKPKWPTAMRRYIISRLARWESYRTIYDRITDPKFMDETAIPHLDPKVYTYTLFRSRCRRISKHTIALAHAEWLKESGAIKWATDKERLQGLSELIDKVNAYFDSGEFDKNTTGTMASLVAQLRGLYEQIRKEVSADADRAAITASGSRVLLANPYNVQIDVAYFNELLLLYRKEVGGLHTLKLNALSIPELEKLRDTCDELLFNKINGIEDATIREEDEDDENHDG